VVLIGDAMRCASWSGCNASLEDVLILGHLLETYKDDWGRFYLPFLSNGFPMPTLQELSDYSFPQQEVGG